MFLEYDKGFPDFPKTSREIRENFSALSAKEGLQSVEYYGKLFMIM